MTFWSFGRLNAKVTEGNRNRLERTDRIKPLVVSWSIILIRKRGVCAEMLAVGKYHINPSLSEINERNILFNLNHVYTIREKLVFVKGFFQLFFKRKTDAF
mgnify:CR=1 FL=1